MKQITTDPGAVYCVYTTTGCTVTDTATGCTLMTAEPGQPNYFAATGHSVTLSDADATCLRPRFKTAPAALRLLGGGDKLPAGYTRLAWLQGTGTQYINTGASGNETSEVLCTFERTSAEGRAIYTQNSTAGTGMLNGFVWGVFEDLRYDWGSKNYNAKGKYSGGWVTSVQSANGVTLNGEPVLPAFESQTFTSAALVLFSNRANVGQFTANNVRMARWALKTAGNPVRDMVAALDPTGTPCMYDRVTGTAYKRGGSGQFIAGVGTVAQLTTLLRNLPSTGGELTLSLPAEANTPEVAEALQACHDTQGWTLTVHEYRPAAVATYSLRRVRSVVWCRREQSDLGSYVDSTATRWQVERCAAIFGPHGQDPTAYGYTPFDSVEAAAEQWGLTPYIAPDEEQV